MKKNSDLDDTKPIEIISDDILGETDEEVETRAEKYKDITKELAELSNLNEEMTEEDKELTEISEEEKAEIEKAEEALAEKNINEAEKILSEEKDGKKKKSLKEKWQSLPKKKKIIIIVCGVLLLLLLIGLIVFLATRKPKEEPKKEEKVEKEIKISDNFYYKDGLLYILDDNDKEIGTYKCKNKSEKRCYVAVNNYRDTLDVPILMTEEKEKVERMPVYNNEYVFIYDNKKSDAETITLYSLKEKKRKETFQDAKAFDNDFLILKDSLGKYGFYQFKDKLNIVISPTYDNLYMIDSEDYLVGKNSKGYILLSKVGKELSTPIPETGDLKFYNPYYLVFKNTDKYSVYGTKAELIQTDYRFITLKDRYIFLVNNENKLTVRDVDKTKYTEEGITLNNTDYVQTLVYDENGKLKKTKRAFTIEVNKASIEIMPYTKKYEEAKNVSINIKEGELNKTLNFYSYLGGTLYFYKDAEKETLIGSYKCNKVNNVTASSMALQNCLPASDTIFEDNDMMAVGEENRVSMAPLFNSRYIFITDGAKNIVLYDLVEKKKIVNYTEINTYTAANDNKLTLVDGDYNVIAVYKNGSYGGITVGAGGVKALYPFNYNHIEKVGKRFIAQKNNSWLFLDDGNASLYGAKIRGYNDSYVKTKDSSYKVADTSGSNISSSTYKYVELYDSFYAGVDKNNKLMIYDYDGDPLLDKSLSLITSTYTRTANPAFKVSFTVKNNARTFKISIFDGSKYKDTVVEEKGTVVIKPDEPKEEPKEENKEENNNQNNENNNNEGNNEGNNQEENQENGGN